MNKKDLKTEFEEAHIVTLLEKLNANKVDSLSAVKLYYDYLKAKDRVDIEREKVKVSGQKNLYTLIFFLLLLALATGAFFYHKECYKCCSLSLIQDNQTASGYEEAQ